jgi:hypothetical protein
MTAPIGELGVPVADQEAERCDLIAQVHQKVAGSRGGPGRGRVNGYPENVHPAGEDFHGQVCPGCDAGVATGPFLRNNPRVPGSRGVHLGGCHGCGAR